MDEIEKAKEALEILQTYNRLNNDLEAYLFEIAEWGRGNRQDKPMLQDFGIDDD